MTCFNCKVQIPDTSVICPNCGVNLTSSPSMQTQQPQQVSNDQMQLQEATARTHHEIKKRRWQRWFFYVVLIVVFGAMVAYMAMIYQENANYIESITATENILRETQGNLSSATQNIASKDSEISQLRQATVENQKALDLKMQELKTVMDQQSTLLKDFDQYKNLGTTALTLTNTLTKVSTNISAVDLGKIPLADYNLDKGEDTDTDGLSDEVEDALGTDKTKADTDGDKFNDKQEILSGYDPIVIDKKLPLDNKFAQANKGKVFKDAKGYLWYVSMDAKKYFLGKNLEATQ